MHAPQSDTDDFERIAEEAVLLQKAKDGDVSAFIALLDAYKESIKGWLIHRYGCRQDADDLYQEVCMRFFRSMRYVRPGTSVRNFLFSITKHSVIDHGRSRRTRIQGAVSLDGEHHIFSDSLCERVNHVEVLQHDELLARVHQVIAELFHPASEDRRMLDLLYFHGHTHAEAAEALGVCVRTIRRKWAAVRQRLSQSPILQALLD